ncbi:hypothetical protein E5Q_01861 [Mixia osmundae IAM 14324]|uniref:Mitochondrial import inner membrane translocase subunit TIM22 n=1 Tax=Mixia osmundae (strain CBS 9802 / IAM 14324 / JCM 22182 / KY 12970) TaxID=764103 RepID=G7DX95_MIXOS|nr:hypothetical protein E5Q_01861 [Mixia osmundae IAM 14324]
MQGSSPLLPPYIIPETWGTPTPEEVAQFKQMKRIERIFSQAPESALFKAGMSGVVGGGLGAFLSLVSVSFAYEDPFRTNPNIRPDMSTMKKTGVMFADMGKGMYRQGKTWGRIGFLFAGAESIVEGYRAKHDPWNPFFGGLITGSIISRKSGLRAASLSGLGFGLFGAAIEHFFIEREKPDDP